MTRLLALALVLAASPVSAQTVEVAYGDWTYLPRVEERDLGNMSANAITRIHDLVASGDCVMPGQSKRRLDMTVPFALQFAPDGALQRLVLPRMNCPEAESILGGTLLELVEIGRYTPTGENDTGWYRGELSFSSS